MHHAISLLYRKKQLADHSSCASITSAPAEAGGTVGPGTRAHARGSEDDCWGGENYYDVLSWSLYVIRSACTKE